MDSKAWRHSFASRIAGAVCVAVTGALVAFLLATRAVDYGSPSIASPASAFVIMNTHEMAPETAPLPVKAPEPALPAIGAIETPLNFGAAGSADNPGDGFSDWSAGKARPDGDAFSILSLRRAAATVIPSAAEATRQKLVLPVHKTSSWPTAPSPAELEGIGGLTTMIFCISPEGDVTEVRVAGKSGSPALDNRAREWLLRQKFEPGSADGARIDFCGWNDFAWKKLLD